MKTTKTNEIPWCPKLRGGTDYMWFPVIGQVKVDGEYTLIRYNKGQIYSVNKYGLKREDYPALNKIRDQILKSESKDDEITLIAELHWGEGKNGDLYHLLSNKKSDDVRLYVHDIMIQGKTTSQRMDALFKLGFIWDRNELLTEAEVLKFYQSAVDKGWEGVVFKPVKAELSLANRWVKMKATDETNMKVINMCEGQERVELSFSDGNGTTSTCGAKCPMFVKKDLKLGDTVLVRHFGFLEFGVRNPIIIKINKRGEQ